jgi:hypothetical protein
MIFNKEDYAGLSFDIFKAKDKDDIISILPELKDIKSFTELDFEVLLDTGVVTINAKDRTKIIKYIVLMYDKESPFQQRFKDLSERKRQAAIVAGYSPGDPMIQVFQDVSSGVICRMIVDFVIYQNDLTWSMLVSNEQTFYEYQNTLMSPTMMIRNDKDKIGATVLKSKLLQDCDDIAKRIVSYRKQLFVDPKIEKTVKISFSPERVANTI